MSCLRCTDEVNCNGIRCLVTMIEICGLASSTAAFCLLHPITSEHTTKGPVQFARIDLVAMDVTCVTCGLSHMSGAVIVM
jgi:hypothetical protein